MIKTSQIVREIKSRGVQVSARRLHGILNLLVEIMSKYLEEGKPFRLSKFGVFKTCVQINRHFFDIYRAQHFVVPRTIRVRFRPMKKLADRVKRINTDRKVRTGRKRNASQCMDAIDQAL